GSAGDRARAPDGPLDWWGDRADAGGRASQPGREYRAVGDLDQARRLFPGHVRAAQRGAAAARPELLCPGDDAVPLSELVDRPEQRKAAPHGGAEPRALPAARHRDESDRRDPCLRPYSEP